MAETVLKDIGLYKSRLLTPIMDSDDIKELLLVGREYTDEMWYGNDEDPNDYGIVYDQIFPYLYMDDTQTEVMAYVCIEVDVPRIPSGTIKDMKIIVWCVCNKQAMKYRKKGYLGNRVDQLADAVERALRDFEMTSKESGKASFGIGDLELSSVSYITSINKKYYGRQLVFNVPEFKVRG